MCGIVLGEKYDLQIVWFLDIYYGKGKLKFIIKCEKNCLSYKVNIIAADWHKEPGHLHAWYWFVSMESFGVWFNQKMSTYQYRKSHCGDKTILRPSYLHNGVSYTGKMTLYWITALLSMWEGSILHSMVPTTCTAVIGQGHARSGSCM